MEAYLLHFGGPVIGAPVRGSPSLTDYILPSLRYAAGWEGLLLTMVRGIAGRKVAQGHRGTRLIVPPRGRTVPFGNGEPAQ